MLAAMRIISWNLLRLEGAAVGDVVALLEREKPDVLLMQEVTQHMDALPSRISGHYHRLPWPGRIHGLAVWSRHHFSQPHVLPLPASRLPGRRAHQIRARRFPPSRGCQRLGSRKKRNNSLSSTQYRMDAILWTWSGWNGGKPTQ